MRSRFSVLLIIFFSGAFLITSCSKETNDRKIQKPPGAVKTLNEKTDGYRGVWYFNQKSNDEYVYKYSGGLGTYCAKHRPFAVYSPQVDKTFFCYGGATEDNNRQLLHMVSYFDHKTGKVPRPTLLLDKQTTDAHDNPVISIDDDGHIWIFSTSHGRERPSFIHKSAEPYDISRFERIDATYINDKGDRANIDNFSYMQIHHITGKGFKAFFTIYHYPAERTICFTQSNDGVKWGEFIRLGAIEKGHYQISEANERKAGTAFNMHPQEKDANWRTNLYYLETTDEGKSWQNIEGEKISVPILKRNSEALVKDYASAGLNVYLKDIAFDEHGNPVILYITSRGYQAGPENDPRIWTIAAWDSNEWKISAVAQSDNNYDMGSLYIMEGRWFIIGPSMQGPQPYNPGGEVAMYASDDRGKTCKMMRQLTKNSPRNHTYVRRPVNFNPDFMGFWADGHGRKPSISNLYFCNMAGYVFVLPRNMKGEFARPVMMNTR